jgi:chromosome segregation ATPase
MSYLDYQKNEARVQSLLAEAQRVSEQNTRLSQTPEFKDGRIRELEREVAALKEELAPHRRREAQQRIDDYGNMKCTDRIGCGCRTCRDL